MKLLYSIKFNDQGLVPAIIQNDEDGRVLTLCYMNSDAITKTLETGKVHVFRRSKGRLMLKGESSGHIQEVRDVFIDCEGNSILFRIKQHVAGCHAGYMSCYYRRYDQKSDKLEICEEKVFDPDSVY